VESKQLDAVRARRSGNPGMSASVFRVSKASAGEQCDRTMSGTNRLRVLDLAGHHGLRDTRAFSADALTELPEEQVQCRHGGVDDTWPSGGTILSLSRETARRIPPPRAASSQRNGNRRFQL